MKYYCQNMIQTKILPRKEDIKICISGVMLISIAAIVFFDRIEVSVILSPYLYIWFKQQKTRAEKKQRQRLKEEGIDFFQSFMNCLSAGYSPEESMPVIIHEMSLLYAERKSVLLPELIIMEKKIQMNQTLEQLFLELARKYENEDFLRFSMVFQTAKRRGGNLIQILDRTIASIQRKNEVDQEIITILSGRVFEKNIMKMIPIFLIGYLKVFNPSYLQVMYETAAGRICMSISLIAMITAGKMADRLVEIEV